MSIEDILVHVTPSGGNVFLDLGFSPDEAALLLAEADHDTNCVTPSQSPGEAGEIAST